MTERERDKASARALQQQNAKALAQRVRMLHAAGLTDWGIGQRVRLSTKAVATIREHLGLPANKAGAQ